MEIGDETAAAAAGIGNCTSVTRRFIRLFRISPTLLLAFAVVGTLWFAAFIAGTGYDDAETLRMAGESGNLAAVLRALNRGVDVDAVDAATGMTPLMYAARKNRMDVAWLLLTRGADVNATSNGHGTPLAIAGANGHADMVKLLLEHGADPNFGSPDGFTPLMHATVSGDVETTRALIRAGANVNAISQFGHTALMAARWNGHDAMAECLINARAVAKAEPE